MAKVDTGGAAGRGWRQMISLAQEISKAIESAAEDRPSPDRKFDKRGEYVSSSLPAPQLATVLRAFQPRLLALSLDERIELAATLLAQHVGELGHAGIHVLALRSNELEPRHVGYLDRLADDLRGWSQVDDFCITVMQPLLMRHPGSALKLVDRWNRSDNRWKRRASVVTFVRKVGASGVFTDEVLRLCENLAWDPEDLVQKGVGWALKDNLRGTPDRVIPYIKELRRRGASSTVTLYAIRDLKGSQRNEVLAVRKA